MVPLIGSIEEMRNQAAIVRRVAAEVFKEKGETVDYMVGTMIELPRAALTADQIAEEAEFFSFGTNDLTQTTFGISRDDINHFLPAYLKHGIFKQDPFATLDQAGVGLLVKMATAKGRNTRPDLKVGICGEHGGDPESVKFCHKIGLNYVSCSPFRSADGKAGGGAGGARRDSGEPDQVNWAARERAVGDLPHEMLRFLLNSRYCEVDRFSNIAIELFGDVAPGWNRVQAICNWVHNRVAFNYQHARPTKTALDVYTERVGVCRDFQHLAITFCRALNIPARYATGYLGDIGVPVILPMDFSAWFEVYLDDRWWTFDARNNQPRIGRVLMATGRDASDVAMTTSFGQADLRQFFVMTEEETPSSTNSSILKSAI
jgi:hypothetical protein